MLVHSCLIVCHIQGIDYAALAFISFPAAVQFLFEMLPLLQYGHYYCRYYNHAEDWGLHSFEYHFPGCLLSVHSFDSLQ